jgi:hypothetical protein
MPAANYVTYSKKGKIYTPPALCRGKLFLTLNVNGSTGHNFNALQFTRMNFWKQVDLKGLDHELVWPFPGLVD